MILRVRARLGAALVVGLAGCASLTPPTSPDLISGRLSVQVAGRPERSVSGSFELSGSPQQGALVLSGPLGTTAMRARWTPEGALLLRSDGEARYADLDALAEAALGEVIPMAALFDWLRGRPWPGAPARPRADGQVGFEQLGWQIDLGRWGDGALEAVRTAPPAITVRARLEAAS